MSTTIKVKFIDSRTSASDVKLRDFPVDSGSPTKVLQHLIRYVGALGVKKPRASMAVQVQNGDGTAATGTVTAASVSSGVQASGTITAASALAADTVTVNGVVFTAVSGAGTAHQFDISGSDTAAAASLATKINADATLALIVSAANASSAVCTITALKTGTAGNAYTLATSNNTRLAKSAATLTSGAAGDTVTIGATVFTCVNVSPTAGSEFVPGADNTACATNLKTAINANTTVGPNVTATSALGVVTLTATTGTVGNLIALATSNNTRLAKSGTFLTGGADDTASTTTYHYGV